MKSSRPRLLCAPSSILSSALRIRKTKIVRRRMIKSRPATATVPPTTAVSMCDRTKTWSLHPALKVIEAPWLGLDCLKMAPELAHLATATAHHPRHSLRHLSQTPPAPSPMPACPSQDVVKFTKKRKINCSGSLIVFSSEQSTCSYPCHM